MQKRGKKRLVLIVILLIVLVIEFIAYKSQKSKGQNAKTIEITMEEYNGINAEIVMQQAMYGDNGYYLILPEKINNKIIKKYYFETQKENVVSKIENLNSNNKISIQKVVNSEELENENVVIDEKTNSIIEENIIEQDFQREEEENETGTESENIIQENIAEDIPQEFVDTQNEIEQENKIIEYLPNETMYLTPNQVESGKIKIQVVYDSKELEGKKIYNQIITKQINSNNVEISGYLPYYAEVIVENVQNENLRDTLDSVLDDNSSLQQLFTIKVLEEGKEFDCKEYGEKIKVKIDIDSIEKEYKVLEIDSNKITGNVSNAKYSTNLEYVANREIEEKLDEQLIVKNENNEIVNGFDIRDKKLVELANTNSKSGIIEHDVVKDANSITFETDSLRTFAIVQTIATNGTQTDTIEDVVTTGAKWNGTIATSFSGGDGSRANPFLILDGSELAYLREQVNSGNSYDGNYFQITGDIDLNNRIWIPIGNTENPFEGIFDGAGHSISNGVIETENSLQSHNTYNYGIFGTIQGNTTVAQIKNTEFNNIKININNLSNNTEVHVGAVVGTMYRKSKISNVLVKSASIHATRDISVSSNTIALLVGGIAGEARDTNTSTEDPGEQNRYSIENCFVSVTIDNSSISSSGRNYNSNHVTNVAQISTGGVIGRIRSQNVWPQNCLISANINSTGLIGPIFGSCYQNTSYNDYNNLNTLWMGNDSANGNNLTMTSYYNSYSVNGTAFTSTNTTGTTPSTSDYRLSTSITSGNWWTTYNIGYVQGMNKGTRLTNTSSMLTNFNNYYQDDSIDFLYSNGEFSLKRRLVAGVTDNGDMSYTISVDDNYNIGNYTYNWYVNNVQDMEKTGATEQVINESFSDSIPVRVIVSDGEYFGVVKFAVPRLFVRVELEVDYNDATNYIINGTLTGPGTTSSLFNINDYTYKWYVLDIAGINEELIEGVEQINLQHAQDGLEYRIVATNNTIPELSAEANIIVGQRNVVYVAYNSGRDDRLGDTEETAVKTLSRAYQLLPADGTRNRNIIVLIENYTQTNSYNDSSSTVYNKNATVTGAYKGIRYSPNFYMYSSEYKYLLGDSSFQYLTFYGGNSSLYLYAQGYDLLIGEEVTMTGYTRCWNKPRVNYRSCTICAYFWWLV